jgi:hypothetical protein
MGSATATLALKMLTAKGTDNRQMLTSRGGRCRSGFLRRCLPGGSVAIGFELSFMTRLSAQEPGYLPQSVRPRRRLFARPNNVEEAGRSTKLAPGQALAKDIAVSQGCCQFQSRGER